MTLAEMVFKDKPSSPSSWNELRWTVARCVALVDAVQVKSGVGGNA